MKIKCLTTLIFVVATANTVCAQDVVSTSGVTDWSGLYVGGIVGLTSFDDTSSTAAIGSLSANADSATVGGELGISYEFNNWVVGIEGDISWADTQAGVSSTVGLLTFNGTSEVDWVGTVTGQIGYAFDNILVYGEAGIGIMDVTYEGSVAGIPGASVVTDTRTGWLLGAGAKVAFTENLIAKLEYDYIDYGSETYNFTLAGSPTAIKIESDEHLLRLGVSYRFATH